MRFSFSWLKDHLETTATAQQIADKLFTLGIEVEETIDQAAAFDKVVIGHVDTRDQHPDADKLSVCSVNIGDGENRQIVCGAPNVRAGLTVAVAIEGACLPGDFKIKKSKIRGIESRGMICSARELELGDDHSGIMELETDAAVGTPFAQAMGLDDVIFDVSITPNRGDALSVYGLARDLAATGIGTLKPLKETPAGTGTPNHAIEISSGNCPYFSGISITGLKNCESPLWLRNRLEAAGLRPRNALVDVTNYVLMDLGQPLHAYDADKLQGTIKAADAQGGEQFKGVVGDETYTLGAGDIVIMDDSGIIGLGGVLGGASTAVDDNTTNVFLEAAWFDRSRIARTGQAHQINSDARFRFERGIDPAMTAKANQIAAQLMQELCGGTVSALAAQGSDVKDLPTITLDPQRLETFGGHAMEKAEIIANLKALQFDVTDNGATLSIVPPSFRTYMETPEDVIEEVLRLKGFDAIEEALLPLPEHATIATPTELYADRFSRRHLVAHGFTESINYSFISAEKAQKFAQGAELMTLANPIDGDQMSTMRPSLIPGLLDAVSRNMARGAQNVQLAEVGHVYTKGAEWPAAAAIRCGKAERHWQGADADVDLYTLKADLFTLIAAFGYDPEKFQIRTGAPETFHPGRSGVLALGKDVVASFGELHPTVLKAFDLKGPVAVFEINLEKLTKMKVKQKSFSISTYQPVNKDMAFLVDHSVAAGDLLKTVQKAAPELMQSADIFDVYAGDKLPEGKKSVAITFTLQAPDRTLTDADIKAVMDKASDLAAKNYGAELRSS